MEIMRTAIGWKIHTKVENAFRFCVCLEKLNWKNESEKAMLAILYLEQNNTMPMDPATR